MIDLLTENQAYQPIPEIAVTGWRDIPVAENNEPLVPIGLLSDHPTLFTSSIYYGERSDSPYQPTGLHGALITIFARTSIAERLEQAQHLLPAGYRLVIFDIYRPLHVQRTLFNHYLNSLRQTAPHTSEEDLIRQTEDYVYLPSQDSDCPSPHNTGGAVDVALIQLNPTDSDRIKAIDEELHALQYESNWSLITQNMPNPYTEPNPAQTRAYELQLERTLLMRSNPMPDFGTPYDHGGIESQPWFYERDSANAQTREYRDNRRLLHHVMTHAGFAGDDTEWWHFNAPETQIGATILNADKAHFGAAQFTSAHDTFETLRRHHHTEMIQQYELTQSGPSHIQNSDHPHTPWTYSINQHAITMMITRHMHPTHSAALQAAVIQCETQPA